MNLLIFDRIGINHKKCNMIVIGRKDKDRVDFPQLRLCDIDAKVDTGAYTSAIHLYLTKCDYSFTNVGS